MFCCKHIAPVLVLSLLLGYGTAQAQKTPAAQPAQPPALAGPVRPDTVTARKAAVQQQLEALGQSNVPKEDLEATRASLEQLLKVLTTLEDAFQKRATSAAQLEGLPQRLRELAEAQRSLETRPPQRFPQATEQLRDEYEAQVHTLQVELHELHKQTTAGDVRLVAIVKELEQLADARRQLDTDLLTVRSQATTTGEHKPIADVELLELELQLVHAEDEALEAEREWLTKRAPLQDALLSVAQVRHQSAQQDLDTIQQALSIAIQQERHRLSSTAATMEQQLEQTLDPTEALKLVVHLETVDIRQATAEYRQPLNLLGDDLLTQEQRNVQVRQDVERLTSLVEKYASGEGIAHRLLLAFERLRRERLRYNDASVKALETRVQALTAQMFPLDDQLYDFRQQAESRLNRLMADLQALPPQQRAAEGARVRQALDEQKAALREQQQVLAELLQDNTTLLALHREYKRLLDDSYLFVLTKMFWLRDAKTLQWDTLYDTVAVAISAVRRLQGFLHAAQAHVRATWARAVLLWLLVPLVCLVLPWVLYRVWRRLRQVQVAALTAHAGPDIPPGFGVVAAIVAQVAVWPGYLALVAWLLGQSLAQLSAQRELTHALVSGLHIGALLFGISLLGRILLQPEGWGQRCWACSPALCRLLRRTVVVTCLAALVFLVPRHILLTAPGEGETAVGSLLLARTLFLAFQSVVVLLVGVLGRRRSPLVEAMLAHSRQRDGLLWRIWPFVYLLLLTCLLGLIGLDMLGYRYAARFIWWRALGSLSVVLTLRVLLVMLLLRLLRGMVGYVFSIGGRLRQRYPDVEAAAERYFGVLSVVCKGLLVVLAATVILELWGLSVSWFLTAPLGWQILTRTLIIALSMGLTIVVTQISNALTDYLLQPRTTVQGGTREPSRKLKTLAPLIQTLIKVGAVFAAVLVVLEQLGVSTGPILTGVGIFGLAVGFASQSLIKDVINGLFILFEDSLSVGDVVTLRGTGGQVEKVTLRAITIRDLYGSVHVIPNSSIDMITNMSREYSRYVLDVGVAYREDVDEVMRILRDIDEAMRRDPEYGKDILEPIEVLGLERFAESAVVIRALLKTRSTKQGRIGHEFNRRLKKVFDERGIEMPFQHRVVYWRTSKDGTAWPALGSVGGQQVPAREDVL